MDKNSNDIKMDSRKHNKMRSVPFIIWFSGLLCGLASIIVDIDHPLFQTVSRAWHPIFAFIGFGFLIIGIGFLIAYICRLYKVGVLK